MIMTNLKLKSVKVLDEFMKRNLERQESIFNDHDHTGSNREFLNECMRSQKAQLEIVMLFCNDTLGRVEVNKLCRKYKINNYDGGLP